MSSPDVKPGVSGRIDFEDVILVNESIRPISSSADCCFEKDRRLKVLLMLLRIEYGVTLANRGRKVGRQTTIRLRPHSIMVQNIR